MYRCAAATSGVLPHAYTATVNLYLTATASLFRPLMAVAGCRAAYQLLNKQLEIEKSIGQSRWPGK
jgi:hypothetical protein